MVLEADEFKSAEIIFARYGVNPVNAIHLLNKFSPCHTTAKQLRLMLMRTKHSAAERFHKHKVSA